MYLHHVLSSDTTTSQASCTPGQGAAVGAPIVGAMSGSSSIMFMLSLMGCCGVNIPTSVIWGVIGGSVATGAVLTVPAAYAIHHFGHNGCSFFRSNRSSETENLLPNTETPKPNTMSP
ncbi:MAG: hypothetical protein KAT71_06115 [Gammaproteobacteria bacterium]|nr:hypothetical protein [Gammaproteobacteria bacterium]